MTATELAEEVWRCLPADVQERVYQKDMNLIVKLVFETITESLLLGEDVRIRNFGRIAARYIKGGNLVWCEFKQRKIPRKPNIKLEFTPAERLRKLVAKARGEMRALAKAKQEESHGEVRLRTGEEGRESEGGS
jgi:nucleoid DNA-binding protein